ncbi:sigma-70 family RNA polymerase sigma factor [Caenispirillum bisanense]|uniref:RNA polymerase sigma factor n=1 Tax=Caenispirillum bisanense TaxID=414052 RepID=A0A286G477_9PROT|nr:sigma-70 family RNA polymerase sigma factor [Caenispirillum bisanense]SOD90315.1 RNA polymerase sigma-70 factor, ECF subfamily [Caenispirillum bisanense]
MRQTETAEPPVFDAGACLVAVGRDRDKAAFAQLFSHYAPRLKAYMRKLGADDTAAEEVAQEALLAVWRKAHLYDPAKASAGTWIFAVARNMRIDMIRREKRPEIDAEDPALVPDAEPRADDHVGARQREALVREAIRQLPPEQAEVVRLSFYEEKPHAEIAEVLQLPLGTVKSRLRLAFRKVRTALGDDVE